MFGKKFIISGVISLTYLSLSSIVYQPTTLDKTDISRKIGIFSVGLLATKPGMLQIEGPFKKSTLTLPVEISRVSAKGTSRMRLNRIYDKDLGLPIHMWYTTSKFSSLLEAIENLAKRKHTTPDKIFYIRTLAPGMQHLTTERPILNTNGLSVKDEAGNIWYIYERDYNPKSMKDKIALAKWANDQKYNAVIWTGFEKAHNQEHEPLKQLLHNKEALANTKKYIQKLPDPSELTPFEKNALADRI